MPIVEDTTIHAKWEKITYTVTFETYGGTAVASQSVKYLEFAKRPTTDPTKDGHTFGGWFTNDSFDTEFNFTTMAIKGDTTIYAKFDRIPYTVTFETEGGTISDPSVSSNQKTVLYGDPKQRKIMTSLKVKHLH